MNFMNALAGKLNFKKIAIWYLIFGFIAGIISIGYLGFTFRDKISFIFLYKSIEEKVEDSNAQDTLNFKNDLKTFAEKSTDIYDILILDNNNKIIFTAKNSDLSSSTAFTLVPGQNEKNNYFTLSEKGEVSFKLVDDEDMILFGILSDHARELERESNDSLFYKSGYQQTSMYLLSYIVSRRTGEKIFFIKNNTVIPNGALSLKIVAALAALFFMLYWVLTALWVYKYAGKAKLNAPLWGLITLFTNIAGLFIFLIYRQNGNICPACGTLQNKNNRYCTACGMKILDSCQHCG